MCVCVQVQVPEEARGVRFPRNRSYRQCELLGVSTGNQAGVLWKSRMPSELPSSLRAFLKS